MLWQNSEGVSISNNCSWFYKISIENNNMVRNAVAIAIIPRLWEMTQKGASFCTKWSERHFLDWKTCSVKWWCTISLSKIWTCMRKDNVSCLKYFFWEVKLGRILRKVNVSLSQLENGSWEEVKPRNMQLKNKNWEYYYIQKR